MPIRWQRRPYLGQKPRRCLPRGWGFFVFSILFDLGVHASEPAYTVVDLGRHSEATAINDNGQVVGDIRTDSGNIHAFLYSNGRVQDLGTLGGLRSGAYGINSAGVVIGWSETGSTSQGHPNSSAFIYADGAMRGIQLDEKGIAPSGPTSACDINSLGQIAVQTPRMHAAIWFNGITKYLGTFVPKGVGYPLGKQINSDGSSKELRTFDEGYTVPRRMNDSGEVVGEAATTDGYEHAFLYSNGRLRDLNMPGWISSHAKDINSRGDVVGNLNLEVGKLKGFLYDRGGAKDLGLPAGFESSSGNGINASGQIVGSASNVTGSGFLWIGVKSRAFLYEKGQWLDLSNRVSLVGSGLSELFDAQRINARGQIIGKAMGTDTYHAYLLTPR
jgi:probable HAF family extracellular repeat protein